jgi:hypothetical protein
VVWQDQSIKTSVIHGSGSEEAVRSLRTVFKKSLNGDIDTEEVASAYAPAFIAASPAGVMCGKNDEQLMHVMRRALCNQPKAAPGATSRHQRAIRKWVEASSVGERSQTIGRVSGERSMKRTAQLLVLICVLLPLPARAQHWAEYRPDGIGYSIELPGEWSVEARDVDTASGVSKSYRATVVIESRAYMTMYSSIPEDAVRTRTITTMLDGARDGAVKNVEGTLRSEEKVLISNLPARYVIVDCPKNVVLAARFFLLGNILVQGLVAGPPGIESESATKRMLGSLKVVKR